ncbi:MAG: septum formation inhibitor Maf [Bacillaceae bacterium]|nr:septum formation inhibitor Maf [Bacillaceae bacterium]
MYQLILGSSSPRRKMLLEQVQIPFVTRVKKVDESQVRSDSPEKLVQELAKLKGANLDVKHEREVILTADTVVAFENEVLEKPRDEQDAVQMLQMLSGRQHDVLTGVMLKTRDEKMVFAERTTVEFWDLTDEMIERYVSTTDPFDKAGAYGIQSGGAVFVKRIIGDYYNVVGLPLSKVIKELERYSIYPFSGNV